MPVGVEGREGSGGEVVQGPEGAALLLRYPCVRTRGTRLGRCQGRWSRVRSAVGPLIRRITIAKLGAADGERAGDPRDEDTRPAAGGGRGFPTARAAHGAADYGWR